MEDKKVGVEVDVESPHCEEKKKDKKRWETPKLEDVSGKVMAQPYIRFT